MNSEPGRGPPRAVTRLSNLGREDVRLEGQESAPITNLRAQIDFSAYLGPLVEKRKTGLEKEESKLSLEDTDEVASDLNKFIRHDAQKRIKLFALKLAFIEKAARRIGTLASLWATVVILGGFSTSLAFADFGVVAVTIFAEALRIFIRSHELGWQIELARNTKRKFQGKFSEGISSSVPFVNHLFKPHVMSRILYLLQLVSAVVCIGLPIWRLSVQGFCYHDDKGASGCKPYDKNLAVSMNLFYGIAVLEAALFLLGKGYFYYQMRHKALLSRVREELYEGRLDQSVLEKFYYTVYDMCLKGSIFDGLDFVAFGIQWLQSDDYEQQIHGAKLLNGFVSAKGPYKQNIWTGDALRRLSTSGMMERLVDLLSSNSEHEYELVVEIASILYRLIADGDTGSRFVAVPRALEAIVSLLMPHAEDSRVDNRSSITFLKVLQLRVTGLKILRHLCAFYTNILEIGKMRGLVPLLVLHIQVQNLLAPQSVDYHVARWRVLKNSLQVLHCLAINKSTSGRTLRLQIASIGSLATMRDVIKDCDTEPYLQLLSMKILYHLALENNVRCSIGATGGIIRLLFNLYRQNDAVPGSRAIHEIHEVHALGDGQSVNHKELKFKQNRKNAIRMSGEVLSRLTFQNKDNCLRLLTLKDKDGNKSPFVDVMIASLEYGQGGNAPSAAEILRCVLQYAYDSTRMEIAERSARIALPNVVHSIADTESSIYEVSLGLASRAMNSLPPTKYKEALSQWIPLSSREHFVRQLVKNLTHSPTRSKVPQVRRYSVEVITALVERDQYFLDAFARLKLEEELEEALDSISEVENFILVSELTGYARHTEDIKCLVLRCLDTLNHSARSKPIPQNVDTSNVL